MLLDDLGTYLQTQGVGTLEVDLFLGGFPLDTASAPVHDAIMALIETAGMGPFHVHNQQQASFERPTIQVATRGAAYGYAAARTRSQAAFNVLDGSANMVLSGTQYLSVLALQSPFFLHTDQANRPVIVFNVLIAKAI